MLQTQPCLLVEEAFKLFATGTYNVDALRKEMVVKGLTLSKDPFSAMLRNPVYIGKIRRPAYKNEPEEIFEGKHEPIISEDLFAKVQSILEGKKRIKLKKNKVRVEFPLRGFLVCNSCGKHLNGSISKGVGGRYSYYHCQRQCPERYRAELIHSKFEEWLKTITLKPELAELYMAVMEDTFKTNEGDREYEIKKSEAEIVKKREMLKKITDKFINDDFDKETYNSLKNENDKECADLRNRIEELKMVENGFLEYCKYSLSLLSNLEHYYRTSTLEGKQKLVSSIFPEKLIFDKKTYRTKEINEILDLLCSKDNSSGGSEMKKTAKKSGLSCEVARTRIELVFRP